MSDSSVQSADEWAAAIAAQVVPLGVVSTSADFTASINRRDLADDLRVTHVASAANTIQRARRHISSSDSGFVIVHLNVKGSLSVSQHERQCRLDGTGATVYTTDSPSSFVMSSDYEGVLVQLPREMMPVPDYALRQSLVKPFAPSALLRVTMQMAASAHAEIPHLEQVERSVVAHSVLDLVASLVNGGTRDDSSTSWTLFLAIRNRIEQEFRDPGLNVTTLAERFTMSSRLIHRLFAEQGLHPAACIRQARINEAKKLLSRTELPIASISAMCGFGDVTTYYRAFRRETSQSPGSWRAGNTMTGSGRN